MLLTHTHTRLLLPGLAQLADPTRPRPARYAPPPATTGRLSINSPRTPDSLHDTKT